MRITGDSVQGKAELDNFIDPESKFPVIATTSDLLTTGVDAKTCKLIVLDKTITSMTVCKQIIGRGSRGVVYTRRHITRAWRIHDFGSRNRSPCVVRYALPVYFQKSSS
jgi:type I site-specific restriction endonuclease